MITVTSRGTVQNPCRRNKGRKDGNNPEKEKRNPSVFGKNRHRQPKALKGSKAIQTVSKSWESKGKHRPQSTPAKEKKAEAHRTKKPREHHMHLEARKGGGLKVLRKKKTHRRGTKRIKALKKARSHQGMKRKGQVKRGTPQNGLAEGGNPKRRQEKKKRTKTFSMVPNQPSSRYSMEGKQGSRQRSLKEAAPP
jgi:hypothetical protein